MAFCKLSSMEVDRGGTCLNGHPGTTVPSGRQDQLERPLVDCCPLGPIGRYLLRVAAECGGDLALTLHVGVFVVASY